MKTKKFNKKLTLKKVTVADLRHSQMSEIQGGDNTPASCLEYLTCTCTNYEPTCPKITCPVFCE